VSFGQIVKAAEPAFAALIGTMFYSSQVSTAKWLCLIPVIGGVALASLGELDFTWAALITAATANVFAAFRSNENKKLMETEGLKQRMGSVGNQFTLIMINSFLFCSVLVLLTEGRKFGSFIQLASTNRVILMNLIYSGLWFFAYNELATMTIAKTSAVTQSVANTAKRVIVIVGVAMILGESLDPLKLTGCAIGVGGVFLYSIIDKVVGKINDVLEQSVAASKVEGRASILIATCPVFTGHVNAFTTLVQVIQGTRQGRSLSDLLDLVDQIIYVTIYPACSVDEISDLNSVKEVVSVIQAAVAQQIQQIQSIISHVQEDTLAPEDVGISQDVTNIIPPAVLPDHLDPNNLDDVTLCNTNSDCQPFQECVASTCVDSATTTKTTTSKKKYEHLRNKRSRSHKKK